MNLGSYGLHGAARFNRELGFHFRTVFLSPFFFRFRLLWLLMATPRYCQRSAGQLAQRERENGGVVCVYIYISIEREREMEAV